MNLTDEIKKPSKEDQQVALESSGALKTALSRINSRIIEIGIDEVAERIKIPVQALRLLERILEVTAQGKPISIVPLEMEVTTQFAADFLGCSRPHLIKILEDGLIPFTTVGRHRRIKFEDIQKYKKAMKAAQRQLLVNMMRQDQDFGMYDS
jgi:excisionase family DNA binding protein